MTCEDKQHFVIISVYKNNKGVTKHRNTLVAHLERLHARSYSFLAEATVLQTGLSNMFNTIPQA